MPSVAERLPSVPPKAMPEIVEFWSWLLPIDEEATTQPLASTESKASFLPESSSCEVEAIVAERSVVLALVAVKEVRVEDAVETKPLLNSRVVEVAFSPVPNFTNG